ncbi:MAG: hAT transposon family protein [Oscillospiraceae bacterium]
MQVLIFLKSNHCLELFPNTAIALRILLTIPVSATGERSFSKLKLIKTYLRASMTQDRLTSLALLSIEKDVAQTLDYGNIISNFASVKARKVFLM